MMSIQDQLVSAVMGRRFKAVEDLLQRGADINGVDTNARCALEAAIGQWDKEMVKYLLQCGANANAKTPHGQYMLMLASQHGKTEITRLLLENGANVNATGLLNTTALMYACMSIAGFNVETVRLLVDSGANIGMRNEKGETALDIAVRVAKLPRMSAETLKTLEEIAVFLKEAEARAAAEAIKTHHETAAKRQERLKSLKPKPRRPQP